MRMKWEWAWNRKTLTRAGSLIVAAVVLAVGLEWLMLRTLPPIFLDSEVDLSSDPTLIDRSVTYLHSSGRLALVEEWSLLRVLSAFCIQLFLLVMLFPLGLGRQIVAKIRHGVLSLKRILWNEKKECLKRFAAFVLVFTAVFVISRVWIYDSYERDNWMTHALCAWAGVAAGSLVTFRRTLAKRAEIFFLALTLMGGGLFAFFLPDATQVALDDGYHFQHALNYSTLGHVRFTAAEWEVMQQDNEKNYRLDRWSEFLAAQDEKYDGGAVYVTSGFHVSLKECWMATHGLGLFLGRMLRMRFWDIWSLGRFTGLAAYALIGYIAVRRLKSGKMILALTLMLPSNIFLAANYTYDPGVTIGTALSCAFWIAQWQEPETFLKKSDAAVMILGMFFACYVKAIYFPIFLLFLFIPQSKFRSRKQQYAYYGTILSAIILIMLYILLPMKHSGGAGDSRADGNVNTFGQLQFILQNPLRYAGILWHFLQDYLDPNKMQATLNGFAYQGVGNWMPMIMVMMAVATFTDSFEEGLLPGTEIRIVGEALLTGSLVLMVTSMYVWFSEVGSTAFNGVQSRYMLPYIYPTMALLGSNRIRNRMNPAVYNGVLLGGMTFAVFSGVMYRVVSYYH